MWAQNFVTVGGRMFLEASGGGFKEAMDKGLHLEAASGSSEGPAPQGLRSPTGLITTPNLPKGIDIQGRRVIPPPCCLAIRWL